MATLSDLISIYTSQSEMSKLLSNDLFGILSIKSFGATGDGATDDTTAVLAAVEYCNDNGFKSIWFPKGTYVVDPLEVTTVVLDGIFLWGDASSFSGIDDTIYNISDFLITYVTEEDFNAEVFTLTDYAATTRAQNSLFHMLLKPGFYKVTEFDTPNAGDITESIKLSEDDSVYATLVTEFDEPGVGDITETLECVPASIHTKVVTEFDTPGAGDIKETATEVEE